MTNSWKIRGNSCGSTQWLRQLAAIREIIRYGSSSRSKSSNWRYISSLEGCTWLAVYCPPGSSGDWRYIPRTSSFSVVCTGLRIVLSSRQFCTCELFTTAGSYFVPVFCLSVVVHAGWGSFSWEAPKACLRKGELASAGICHKQSP